MTQTVIPQLRITDAERSLAFYVDGLGFAVDGTHQLEPGFPLFMQATRVGQSLCLTQYAGDCQVGGAVYSIVPDARACHAEFEQHGVAATNPPWDTPWGSCEFALTDPDRNRLRFASDRA
ncbi:MAG: VOC family protein [Rhodocyclaceae bacterium]|nr:VOC family protein [Rhodocyclaceae bacterium]